MPPLIDSSTACAAMKAPTHLYTVAEASEMWGFPQSTLYSLIRCGDIEALHVGRSVRVTFEQMERFIRQNTR